jgi:hypothetical protein
MEDPQTRAANFVKCKEGNVVGDILEAGSIHEEIQNITKKQFDLATSAQVKLLFHLLLFVTILTLNSPRIFSSARSPSLSTWTRSRSS